MNNKKNNLGYTLVEIMVVVASMGLIMSALVGVILGTFRAQNRNTAINKVSENGTWIINELRKDTFNSFKDSIFCPDDNLSIQMTSLQDGGITILNCDEVIGQIASTSAVKKDILNNKDVKVTDCSSFVMCEFDVDGELTGLNFNFELETAVNGVGASQAFNTKVTLRN